MNTLLEHVAEDRNRASGEEEELPLAPYFRRPEATFAFRGHAEITTKTDTIGMSSSQMAEVRQ